MSASDQIRSVWAYLLGILEVGQSFDDINHPGLLIFDEPRQQSAKDVTFASLLTYAARMARKASASGADCQVIFATSENRERLTSWLPEDSNLMVFEGLLLRPE